MEMSAYGRRKKICLMWPFYCFVLCRSALKKSSSFNSSYNVVYSIDAV